jgi:hypothetical protein
MLQKKKYVIITGVMLISVIHFCFSQKDTLKYSVQLSGLTSTGDNSPFWLQNNSFGTVSTNPNSVSLRAGVSKDFSHRHKYFDYAFKTDFLLRTDADKTDIYFHEYYLKAKVWFVDLTAGAREENLGNQDTTLSSGGFLFSHNSRPMPKITAGIEHFIPVPFTYGYLEIKGALSHGWFTDNIYSSGVLLHHKYLYARVGGRLPVHLQYGLDHVAQWGGYIPGWGQQPSGFSDYLRVFLGKSGADNAGLSDQINALGNSIGSQSLRLDVRASEFEIGTYWQNIFEDGPVKPIGLTMNVADGLWGISIRNKQFPFVKGLVYEYLNTTDQSGPFHDRDGIVYGGNDSYFTGQYGFGWSYFSRTIGTPFITSPVYNTNGSYQTVNSRVQVHHFGVEGDITGFQYRMLLSLSKNYGTYNIPFVEMKRSTDFLLEVNKTFPKLADINAGCSIAFDRGTMYGNNAGVMVTIKKQGALFHW